MFLGKIEDGWKGCLSRVTTAAMVTNVRKGYGSMFKYLKRISYQVDDLAKARGWYCDVLGVEPVYDSPLGIIFNIGDCSLSLAPNRPPLPEDNGRMAVFWEVDDVDAVYQRLIEAGARPHSEIKDVFMIRIAKVVDPFGNVLGLTGPIPDSSDRTVDSQPSQTALGVALCRAIAAHEQRPELKGPDYLAELFLYKEVKDQLENPAARARIISEFLTSRRYGYLIARTAFIDGLFEAALRDATPQIVLLGAGYDTRAHRFSQILGETTVFELDVSTTQDRKHQILQKAGVSTPQQLRYVPVNFKTDCLDDCLARAGFDREAKTFFIWEGVMYYLTSEVVDGTLRFVHDIAPAGSSICFDYMIAKLESVVASEPFLFWLPKDRLEGFLTERGYRVLEHLDAGAIERRFLTLGDGMVAEGSMPHFCFAHASVS